MSVTGPQQSGLRFDIYERVHVGNEMIGIQEMDTIELVPHIRVSVEDDQAVLKGHLWLTGTYIGDHGAQTHTLEHLIPVEITMPRSRITRTEDVAIDIDNFDFELLSSRTLNITGVLSLRGLEVRMDQEESDVFSGVDEAPLEIKAIQTLALLSDQRRVFPEDQELDQGGEKAKPLASGNGTVFEDDQDTFPQQEATPVMAEFGHQLPSPGDEMHTDADKQHQGELVTGFDSTYDESLFDAENDQTADPVSSAKPSEKKLSFSSKKTKESADKSSTSLHSLLGFKKDNRNEHSQTLATPIAPILSDESTRERVDWQRRFLTRDSVQSISPEFRKLRMCIVQKNETLESIADRYKIAPRDIVQHNRLPQALVAEGQVIYIPS